MRRAAGRARPRRGRVPGPHAAPAHRAQLRRGAGRQHRLAPALQLHGDGRHGEPRLAARGRQQVLRHHRSWRRRRPWRSTGDAFAWRELDAIRVKGRAGAVKIYEPLGAGRRGARRIRRRAPQPMPRASRASAPAISPAPRSISRAHAETDPPSALFLRAGAGTGANIRPARTGSRSTRWRKSSTAPIRRSYPHCQHRPSQIGAASAIFCP